MMGKIEFGAVLVVLIVWTAAAAISYFTKEGIIILVSIAGAYYSTKWAIQTSHQSEEEEE